MAFKTEFGHMLVRGDKVVAVVEGFQHTISTITGTFLGVSKSGGVQILTEDGYQNGTRISTLRRNYVFPLPESK